MDQKSLPTKINKSFYYTFNKISFFLYFDFLFEKNRRKETFGPSCI